MQARHYNNRQIVILLKINLPKVIQSLTKMWKK